jgi:two-component system sensor histidine kinase KdpD
MTFNDVRRLTAALAVVGAVTVVYARWFTVANATTVALSFLLVVLVVAATAPLWVAVVASCAAMLCFNFFFLPPVGQFTIADPQNWVALVVFLGVSLVASRLSSTARERALLEARKTADLSRKSEELKSALLASLGHDLRTPLTAIRVAASNLQASWMGEADRREQADIVLTEVERLTRLFDNILDMARIDAGAVSTEPQWVHPSQIVEAASENVGRTLRQHRLEVRAETDLLVRVDPRLTTAALAQLLENAARYSPDGSTIDVATQVHDGDLAITVRDRGPGIPPGDLPRLFDRFYRGAHARGVSGSGIGLSIAQGLLAVEHGRVAVENCPDGGARFTISVPVESRALERQG